MTDAIFDILAESSLFAYIDLVVARGAGEPSEEAFTCLAYLSKCARLGHVVVRKEGLQITPDPAQIFAVVGEENNTALVDSTLFADVIKKITIGFDALPERGNEGVPSCFVRTGNSLYLHTNWVKEKMVKEHFLRLIDATPDLAVDKSVVDAQVREMVASGTLLEQQGKAVRIGCTKALTMILGGPGTGKTYTAGILIQVLLNSFAEERKNSFRVALTAPTGKAVSNLEASLAKSFFPKLQTEAITLATLHSLLGLRKDRMRGRYGPSSPLPFDLILVDETSMVDINVMSQLLASVCKGTRLILIGDENQLPPVEAGHLFNDLIEALDHSGKDKGTIVRLQWCMRSEQGGILSFAQAVRTGEIKQWLASYQKGDRSTQGVRLLEGPLDPMQQARWYELLRKKASSFYPTSYDEKKGGGYYLEKYRCFRILTPMRQGPFGVDAINRYLAQWMFAHRRRTTAFIAPIILTKNHHTLSLFNGETGLLVDEQGSKKGPYALFASKERAAPPRKFPLYLLPHYEYAYCMSVHKSQGSEFDSILLLLPRGSDLFGKEMLYTAATRAKNLLEIAAEPSVLNSTAHQTRKRISNVAIDVSMVLTGSTVDS
ncbi:exodeoxyribonuclease V subunit alpha [Simkania negevensis]|uniref:RecBCD enzyme subunit RecD n=1 Tax=Simkania negevensis TaxID=83561 RepID=A0ABS3AQX1_9BACT|nr:exodeoxyribonuclease V subunit alpha [Simkania negevensis]